MKAGIRNIGFCIPSGSLDDQDTFTIALEACRNSLQQIDSSKVGAIYFGTETKPYAVKSTASMLASALNLPVNVFASDLEFACKAGTSAMQIVTSLIESGRIKSGIAVGSDIAEACDDDILSCSVGAGAAALLLDCEEYFCEIIDFISLTDDVTDFWRSQNSPTPVHEGRFTGGGGYLKYVPLAYESLKLKSGFNDKNIDHMVLHMPNAKYPFKVMDDLHLDYSLLDSSFVFPKYKNCFSACSLLGLTACLEKARPNENIIMISYGSGAGCDAFYLRTNDNILNYQKNLKSYLW